jgi:L-fucose mutarotase
LLRTPLLHPHLLRHVAALGHGSRLLIADGNYPVATAVPAAAPVVHLNVRPGVVSAVDVLEPLVGVLPVEAATLMEVESAGPYALESEPPIWSRFAGLLPGEPLERLPRDGFYEAAQARDVGLVIATAETALYANLLLTVGVVAPEDVVPSGSR